MSYRPHVCCPAAGCLWEYHSPTALADDAHRAHVWERAHSIGLAHLANDHGALLGGPLMDRERPHSVGRPRAVRYSDSPVNLLIEGPIPGAGAERARPRRLPVPNPRPLEGARL